jgi:signal transduction histidine kinase
LLKFELETCFKDRNFDSDQDREHFKKMDASIDKTMAFIRQLSHSLLPPTLDVAGINLSLEDHCKEKAERTGLRIFLCWYRSSIATR